MKTHEEILRIIKPEKVISALSPHINDQRKNRIEAVLNNRIGSVQLAVEMPADVNNALAIIRTAEVLGISEIHIIGAKRSASSLESITKGAFYWIHLHFYKELQPFLEKIKNNNLLLMGGCLHQPASIFLEQVPIDQSLCIILGNEQRGLSPEALQACDTLYQIPMYGMAESLNLSVAAAISLYDILSRKRKSLETPSDLTSVEQLYSRAKFYLNSVDSRLTRILFNETSNLEKAALER